MMFEPRRQLVAQKIARMSAPVYRKKRKSVKNESDEDGENSESQSYEEYSSSNEEEDRD